ncbi:MAG: Asp-tRNA(Asn)/Glu-tRNA(Gln) amidotransferase subunit GatC [Candidatus Lokiarchaeota archaeon]|nr:Asp-tRNA(Asn)/Glu-tRNA(Gln) amidotransferase subunit GatC [Candidatus Lokiarchaeota archaeon]
MSQNFTDDEVKHIAWLCRIKIEDEEIKDYKQKFNNILDYFKKINGIDTENVQPTFHILKEKNRFREDTIKESLSQEEIMQNVPKKKDRFIKGPRIS